MEKKKIEVVSLFRRNEIEGLLSFSALPGPDVSANEAKKDTPRPIG